MTGETQPQPERSDPTQCSGEEGFCPEHGFHRHSLKQPDAGYCPHCGRGDAGPTADQYEASQRRAIRIQTLLDEQRDRVRKLAAKWQRIGTQLGAVITFDDAAEALTAALEPPQEQPASHVYLSTGCLHNQHDYCNAMTGWQGEKRPATCKFCSAPCTCRCHAV